MLVSDCFKKKCKVPFTLAHFTLLNLQTRKLSNLFLVHQRIQFFFTLLSLAKRGPWSPSAQPSARGRSAGDGFGPGPDPNFQAAASSRSTVCPPTGLAPRRRRPPGTAVRTLAQPASLRRGASTEAPSWAPLLLPVPPCFPCLPTPRRRGGSFHRARAPQQAAGLNWWPRAPEGSAPGPLLRLEQRVHLWAAGRGRRSCSALEVRRQLLLIPLEFRLVGLSKKKLDWWSAGVFALLLLRTSKNYY